MRSSTHKGSEHLGIGFGAIDMAACGYVPSPVPIEDYLRITSAFRTAWESAGKPGKPEDFLHRQGVTLEPAQWAEINASVQTTNLQDFAALRAIENATAQSVGGVTADLGAK